MIAAQFDMFASAEVEESASGDELLSPDEERVIIAAIDATELSPFRFQGWVGKRLTSSYGWHYDFEDGGFEQAEAMPPWLLDLRNRAARLAGLDAEALVQALLIRYDPGAGIGWHRDRPLFDHVIGISLGHSAVMRFRRRRGAGFERKSLPLEPRSMYHLSGEMRWEWEHSIAPMSVPRWSVTFRSLSERGRVAVKGA